MERCKSCSMLRLGLISSKSYYLKNEAFWLPLQPLEVKGAVPDALLIKNLREIQ